MKQRVCAERCYKPSVSNCSVSIIRPVSFKDQKYRQYLNALSTATDGAFQFNEPSDQVIQVINPLRTAEKIFSKNGQIFDLSCLQKVRAKIASLAMDGIELKPLESTQEGMIQFKKKNSGYELLMHFEPDVEHYESLGELAFILTSMAQNAGKQIHRDDIEALERVGDYLKMKIGYIATSNIDEYLLSDIEEAKNTSGSTPLGVIEETYKYKPDQDSNTLKTLQEFAGNNHFIEFEPLTIDIAKRQTRRTS